MLKSVMRMVVMAGTAVSACGGSSLLSHQLLAGVVINGGYFNVQVRSAGDVQSDTYAIPLTPSNQQISATLGPQQEYSSSALISYLASGGGATFSHDLLQRHAGGTDVQTYFSMTLQFHVTTSMTYSLSGAYTLGHSGLSGGYAGLSSWFDDYPMYSQTLSYSSQTNGSGPDFPQDVTLGLLEAGTGGMGSLTGTLQAGVTYQWSFSAFTSTSGADHTIDAGSATGNVTLILGDGGLPSAAVPEPGSLAIFGFGALFVAGIKQRRGMARA